MLSEVAIAMANKIKSALITAARYICYFVMFKEMVQSEKFR